MNREHSAGNIDRAADRAARPSWLRRLAIAAAGLAVIALVGLHVVALVPIWPCHLFQHFRVQYAAGGLVVVGCAAALRMGGSFDVAAIATLLHALWIAPDLCSAARPIPNDGVAFRVLLLNVHTESTAFDQVRALIDDVRPDLIGLMEVDRRWLDELAPAVASYPGRLEQPRADNFGVALYARKPLAGAIEQGGRLPRVVAQVGLDGAELAVLLVHPLPPVSGPSLAAQRATLEAVADRARAISTPLLIMGDFNATPWSSPFRRLVDRTGLCDSRAGFGIGASFPATSTVLRIPIDHVLVSCSIGVRERRIERDVGSDHLPVVLDLVVPRRHGG